MTTTVQPALIIGLGGSGIDVVRRFKRRFRMMYPTTPYVRFLGIDTAPQTPEREHLPQLSDDEFVRTSDFRMDFYTSPGYIDQHPSIRGWWKGYDGLPSRFINAGAGMKRPIGRLALFVNYASVVRRINEQLREIFSSEVFFALPEEYRKAVNVYIVSSTCGGTGTGMFLDIAYIARHEQLDRAPTLRSAVIQAAITTADTSAITRSLDPTRTPLMVYATPSTVSEVLWIFDPVVVECEQLKRLEPASTRAIVRCMAVRRLGEEIAFLAGHLEARYQALLMQQDIFARELHDLGADAIGPPNDLGLEEQVERSAELIRQASLRQMKAANQRIEDASTTHLCHIEPT